MKIIKYLVRKLSVGIKRRGVAWFQEFDPDAYLKLNPDVREAGVAPLKHFLEYGRAEKRPYRFPDFECIENQAFDSTRRTVLLVTHESSLTGAPVLVYNIAETLSRTMNVVVLSLGGGTLEAMFQELDVAYVPAQYARFNHVLAEHVIECIVAKFDLSFAIVNSIESRLVIEPLRKAGVRTVGLIHEFASCYPDPSEHFTSMMTLPDQVVFSSEITLVDASRYVLQYDATRVHVLPQGRSNIPKKRLEQDAVQKECQRLRTVLRRDGDASKRFVVLGAGSVNYRKGVDLYLQCARKIADKIGEDACRFVWIGQGYQPRKDAAYSVYLEDQILRAGLSDLVEIIDETTEIETAYALSDLFLLSSRLDPLPNVAIDAMFFKKPLVCFDKTTGIVSFLESAGLRDACVAHYLDIEDLSEKAAHLLLSDELRAQVVDKLAAKVADSFDMVRYVSEVVALVDFCEPRK